MRGALRRRGLILVSGLLAGLIFGVPLSLLERPVYETAARVLVRSPDRIFAGTPLEGALDIDESLDTVVALVRVEPVLAEAARRLRLGDAHFLERSVDVRVQGNSRILIVSGRHSEALTATRIANTLARVVAGNEKVIDIAVALQIGIADRLFAAQDHERGEGPHSVAPG